MYKALLCWRYLLTRYLALACIVSVMLGVATLIVVNSVMSGFSTKLKDRLHRLLSDVLVEAKSFEGFGDAEGKMRLIRASPAGAKIAAMTPTMETFAMMQYRFPGESRMNTRPVTVFGIEPEGWAKVCGSSDYFVRQKGKPHPSFELDAEGKDRLLMHGFFPERIDVRPAPRPGEPPPPDPPPSEIKVPEGIIIGYAIANFRDTDPVTHEAKDFCVIQPGDDVIITTVSGERLAPVFDRFAVCDYFKSEMSEYDSHYVFVPLAHLQKLRTMEDRVTSIQIRLHDYRDAKEVVRELRAMFPGCMVETWEDKQGALLAAIAIEKGILNVLLFLIVGVAGFGILAIFTMIVVEKTRDIGILKALGASNAGVMQIFLGYGLLLGVVGAVLGTGLGLTITTYINEIEKGLSWLTGQEIFPRKVYYFDSIPTSIQSLSVVLVNVGALSIAVLFSVLPALRAAMLHPVRALRYE